MSCYTELNVSGAPVSIVRGIGGEGGNYEGERMWNQRTLNTLRKKSNDLVCISHAAGISYSESSPLPDDVAKTAESIGVARRIYTNDDTS